MASLNTRVKQLEDQILMIMAPDIPKPKVNDEEQPKKKRTSGYILYSNANRAQVKDRLLEEAGDNDKIKNTDVMKELARMWRELDQDQKAIWNTKAKHE